MGSVRAHEGPEKTGRINGNLSHTIRASEFKLAPPDIFVSWDATQFDHETYYTLRIPAEPASTRSPTAPEKEALAPHEGVSRLAPQQGAPGSAEGSGETQSMIFGAR